MRRILNLKAGALAIVVAPLLALSACGGDDGGAAADGSAEDEPAGGARPSVVVSTSILGDIVTAAVGDAATVEVVMPIGADPHDFAPSVRQAESMERADLLVVNGAGLEQGMAGVIDAIAAGGTPVFAFTDHVDLLARDGHLDETDHDETDHDETDHDETSHDETDHEHGPTDPHVWTDPLRVAAAVTALGDELAALDGIDTEALAANVGAYVTRLEELDAAIVDALAAVPPDARVLVTNHEALGYFADRYGFEIVGAVVPSLTTHAESSARELEALAGLIEHEGIPVIFAETTQSTQLADALAEQVGGDVRVVALFTESLGEAGSGAETYLDVMRTDAALIATALTGG